MFFLPLSDNRPALTGFMIRNLFLSSVILLAICSEALAGGEYRKAGARSAAMGNASVTIADVWSGFNNQAGLARAESPIAGIYFENRYFLKELAYSAASFVLPVKNGGLGLTVSQFGFTLWNESRAGVAYARSFGKRFAAGVQLDYVAIHQSDYYGNSGFITFEAGVITEISPKVTIGAHLYNPFNATISKYSGERSSSCLNIGISWDINKIFLVTAEAEKHLDRKPSFNAGVECKIIHGIYIRTGISTAAYLFTFGAGVELKKFVLDFSASQHNVLGFSPQAAISYKF